MTEEVMYFGIGFFVAALLGLFIVVRVHRRAARPSNDQFHADVRQLEEQLAVALGERSELQREIASIKRYAETVWVAERIESALFRERINDVAYEIVRITQALESPGSSIEPMSSYAAIVTGTERKSESLAINGANGQAGAPSIHAGALADRIYALRMTASRAATN
jgi:hypothetical protein